MVLKGPVVTETADGVGFVSVTVLVVLALGRRTGVAAQRGHRRSKLPPVGRCLAVVTRCPLAVGWRASVPD
jgi:hypothetical protein